MLRETHLPQACPLSSHISRADLVLIQQLLHHSMCPRQYLASTPAAFPPPNWALTLLERPFVLAPLLSLRQAAMPGCNVLGTGESRKTPHLVQPKEVNLSASPPQHLTARTHASPCLFQSSLLTVLGAVQAAGGLRGKTLFLFQKRTMQRC